MNTNIIVLFALQVATPSINSNEIVGSTYSIEPQNDYIFSTIFDFINKYIWYAFWVIAFALLLYTGYLLISSEGDSQWLKKANKTLIYGLVGLLIAILSYMIVMFIVNLF